MLNQNNLVLPLELCLSNKLNMSTIFIGDIRNISNNSGSLMQVTERERSCLCMLFVDVTF